MTTERQARLELVCPAGTPAALRVVVEAGADAVYCGYRDETNARNFPGLNFSREEMREAAAFVQARGAKLLVAINTFARAGAGDLWKRAVDDAVAAGADALILADLSVLAYAAAAHPDQRLHLSVQASAASADGINFYVRRFGVRRAVLPRVLTVDEIAGLSRGAACETEVFVFGGLCVMAEGRCSLSSYVTGRSPNMDGVCSPASHVSYEEEDGTVTSRLGGVAVNRFAPNEPAAYPTLCKGRFEVRGEDRYIFEEPTSLNAVPLLKALRDAGVTALKIEGRQRGRAYMGAVVAAFRRAVDAVEAGGEPSEEGLLAWSEGGAGTGGAYVRTWR